MSAMKGNKIRALIREGEPTLNTRIGTVEPLFTEMIGASGNFDYVEFVAEYAPYSQADLENLCRAAELHDMGTMIKVDLQNRAFAAQKAVAAGFQAILFCDHKTPEEVAESVYVLKSDSPSGNGRFGFPNRRYIGFQPYMPQTKHSARLDDVVLAFMIEKKEAMDNIEEICSVPGVDMVQFGPSDYSMSVGWNAGEHREELREIEEHMIEVALKHGVRPRCELYGAPSDAERYIKLGVRDFCFGDMTKVYMDFLNGQGREMRGIADSVRK